MGEPTFDVLERTREDPCWGLVSSIVSFLSPLVHSPSSATALQSLKIACDTILSGKGKVMIAGGFDDISEEGSFEFANMKAMSNAETELAMGREPT